MVITVMAGTKSHNRQAEGGGIRCRLNNGGSASVVSKAIRIGIKRAYPARMEESVKFPELSDVKKT